MIVSVIVAADENNAIGIKNQIPWHLPADLKYFKKHTSTHYIIMGRNTFESIGKPLIDRVNIIITRDYLYTAPSGCLIAYSIEEALNIAEEAEEEEVFIIGGAQIYTASQPFWDRVYFTRVYTVVEDTDVYFPVLDQSEWKLVSRENHEANDKNKFDFSFEVYEKIKNND